jgi:carboxylesterase type B
MDKVLNIGKVLLQQMNDTIRELINSFIGVPFAQPPIGNLRWKSPVEPNSWTTPLNATEYGPQCPQKCFLPTGLCATQMSEDCLSLNIYRPSGIKQEKLPVMVFLPGGHFDMGTANCRVCIYIQLRLHYSE